MNAQQVAEFAMQDYVAETEDAEPRRGVLFSRNQLVALIAVAVFQFSAFAWQAGQTRVANDRARAATARAEDAEGRLNAVSKACAVRLDDGYTRCETGVVVHESQVGK